MNWLKKNMHITILAMMTATFITYLYVTDEKVEHDYILVQEGDSLWSLAEHYRGKMDVNDWITKVKSYNNLNKDTIQIGKELYVPIEEQSIYIANKQREENTVEVVSDYK